MSHPNLREKIFIFLLFLIIFLIGLTTYQDFGIGIDEDNSRINGFVSLKYLFEKFGSVHLENLKEYISVPQISLYQEQGNGVVFDLPLAAIEFLFNISDFKNQFLLRHFFSFFLFFISLIYFYKLIDDRYNSKIMAALGVVILFTTPRIFAHSFFNPKDIGFMSFYIINLYYGIRFLDKPNTYRALIFSLICGLTIGVRILGILLPVMVFLFHYIDLLRERNLDKKKYAPMIIISLTLPIFITIFWPFLWGNPLMNFVEVFKNLSNHQVNINNLFMGNYVSALYVPWYYIFVWIAVSIPILYLLFFSYGFFITIYRLTKRLFRIENGETNNDLWRGKNEKKDLFFLLNIFIPIFLVIIFHSSLYNGWRHFFFIYPLIILILLRGINLINLLFLKKKIVTLYLFFMIVIPSSLWMIKNHPYQHVYFNILAGKKYNNYFDLDYWGVSTYNALNYIADRNEGVSYVGQIGNGDIHLSQKFLGKQNKKKIIITDDFMEADFLIDGHNRWNGIKETKNNMAIKERFINYFDFKTDNISINKIYKKKQL